MNNTQLLIADERRPGGKNHVPRIVEPYEAPFQSVPATNAYTANTPKAWPPETLYTKATSRNELFDSEYRKFESTQTFGAHPHSVTKKVKVKTATGDLLANPLPSANACSKSATITGNTIGGGLNSQKLLHRNTENLPISELQDTLIECGRLKLVGRDDLAKETETINRAYAYQKALMIDHGRKLVRTSSMTDPQGKSKHAESGGGFGSTTGSTVLSPNGSMRFTKSFSSGLTASVSMADPAIGAGTGAGARSQSQPDGSVSQQKTGESKTAKKLRLATIGQERPGHAGLEKYLDNEGYLHDDYYFKPRVIETVPLKLKPEYTKGDWQYAVTEDVRFKPQKRYLPFYGLDVRNDFVPLHNDIPIKKKNKKKPLILYHDPEGPNYGHIFKGDTTGAGTGAGAANGDNGYDSSVAGSDYNGYGAAAAGRSFPNAYKHQERKIGGGFGGGSSSTSSYSAGSIAAGSRAARSLNDSSAASSSHIIVKKPPEDEERSKKANKNLGHSYSAAILDHLQGNTHELGGVYRNPFREKAYEEQRLVPMASRREGFTSRTMARASDALDGGIKNVIASENVTNRKSKDIAPTTYRKGGGRVRQVGSLSIYLSADDSNDNTFRATKVPSKNEVIDSLASITKQNVVAYDMRIVETGALVKALRDTRLPAPGVAAIINLHRAFIMATEVNPDPWNLTRLQTVTVIKSVVPWFSDEAARRFFSAYDPARTGIVRFVRMTSTLLLCCRPAMNDLIALQQRMKSMMEGKILDDEDVTVRVSASKKTVKTVEDYAGEIYVLKLVFHLYEDCDGGVARDIHSAYDPDYHIQKEFDIGRGPKDEGPKMTREAMLFEAFEKKALGHHDGHTTSEGASGHHQAGNGTKNYERITSKCTCALCVPRKKKTDGDAGENKKASSGDEEDPLHAVKQFYKDKASEKPGVGMRLEHISEMLCCAACSMEEEIRMRKYVSAFLQLLYIESQRRLGPAATTAENKTIDYFNGPYQPKDERNEMPVHRILAYPLLKGVKSIPRVTEEVFFQCLPQTMPVLEEFSKQLERFRQLSARHVDKYGTMNFDEALLTKPVGDAYYGTRTNRNSKTYLKKIAAII